MELLLYYARIKAIAKDCVRESQIRFATLPLLPLLENDLGEIERQSI
jgi:hypothetical protein